MRWVALLRGVNVGGSKKVAMADLRAALEAAGYRGVETYIQSGNVVLSAPPGAAVDGAALEADLERCITAATGFDVPVAVRSAPELAAVVDANPFDEPDGRKLHVLFLKDEPAHGATDGIDVDRFAPERFALRGREVYLHLPNGIGRAKLPAALEVLRVPATARNWNTVRKLLELATA